MDELTLQQRIEDLEFITSQLKDKVLEISKYNFQGSQALTKDTTLISGFLQSGNYKTLVSGWKIEANGDAEFAGIILAGGYIQLFRQDAIPTSLHVNDLWIDTNDSNKMYVAASVGADAITAGEWVLTNPASNWSEIIDDDTYKPDNNATLNAIFRQTSVPTALAAGDIWFDTDDTNKPYRATSAGDDAIVTGSATNTVATSPGTMADDATVGTVAWSNPDNAKASDDNYSTVAGLSHYLKATNFGFAIPTGATINGILVEIEQKDFGSNGSENSIKIVKGGVISGDEKSTGANMPDADAYVSYGSSSDLWGLSWTMDDINLTTFGVVFSVNGVTGVSIDHIRITVYYTTISEWIAVNFADIGATVGATSGTDLKNESAAVLYDVDIVNKFGGDGSDGALAITAGTTTIDAAGADIVVKNYTSISITSTAKFTISNPHDNGTILYLRSQGAVTGTSSTSPAIDMAGMGALAGSVGSNGSNGMSTVVSANKGLLGADGDGVGSVSGGAATAGSVITTKPYLGYIVACGAGGGGGGTGSTGGTAGGAGGRGGGVIIIECKGTLNITSTLSVAGANGSAGTSLDGSRTGGGGGGGGGGTILILYKTLTANGTYTITGGNGGNGGSTNTTSQSGAGGGSGGASLLNGGGAGGNTNASGSTGSGTGGGTGGAPQGTGSAGRGGGGGGAGAGYQLSAANIYSN